MPSHFPIISPLRRFLRLASLERKDILSLYLFAILTGLISLSMPLGIQAIFNFVSSGTVTTSWVVLVSMVLLGLAAAGILQILQFSITERLQQRIFAHSAFEFAFRIPRLQAEALRNQSAAELVNRFFDTMTVQKGFSKILLDLSAASLQIIFGLVLLAFYHPLFILFAIVLIGLLAAIIRFLGPRSLATSINESKYKFQLAHWLEELARSIDTFKFAGFLQLPLTRTDELVGNYLGARQRHYRLFVTKFVLVLFLKILILGALLIVGSMLVFSNELNIGQFVAMEVVVILLISAIDKLVPTMEVIYDVLTALDKLGQITDIPMEREDGTTMTCSEGRKGVSVQIRQLRLQFPDQAQPCIDGLEMNLKAGDRINIITSDTAWVTHFFRLLTGFYAGYEGSIAINGVPLQNLNLNDLRLLTGGFSMIQDIFEGSLTENITLNSPAISRERLLEVIEAVGLRGFVDQHPQGLEARLRHSDIDLDFTLRRKVLLARAIVTHPDLLLLHNPFWHIQPEEVEPLVQYIHTHIPRATIIVASEESDPSGLCLKQLTIANATKS